MADSSSDQKACRTGSYRDFIGRSLAHPLCSACPLPLFRWGRGLFGARAKAAILKSGIAGFKALEQVSFEAIHIDQGIITVLSPYSMSS
ncbi:hypothetical protein SLEP1_g59112 [Rubroshorea leprosula]|uniref:Uncharacterized protein n=1 Tax=Rubroshorea leprosula TaxID=152421 RepID=A0AAV5MSG9_9ROSI|nr:hypothetical protein SLEP1_g59112 [Rubroshorea leprosula]